MCTHFLKGRCTVGVHLAILFKLIIYNAKEKWLHSKRLCAAEAKAQAWGRILTVNTERQTMTAGQTEDAGGRGEEGEENGEYQANPVAGNGNRIVDKWFGPVYTEFQGKPEEAEAYLRDKCEGVAKELFHIRVFLL